MITKGHPKDIKYYKDLLQNEYITFIEEVIKEVNYYNKNYKPIAINFESIVLKNQSLISYTGP